MFGLPPLVQTKHALGRRSAIMRHYILPRFGTPTAAAILEFGDLTVFRFVPNSDIFQKDSFFFFFFFFILATVARPALNSMEALMHTASLSLTRYFSVLE